MLLLCGTLTREPCLPNTVRWPVSHNVTCWSKQRKGSSATEYMQSTMLLWAFRADDVSPVKIRPVFSCLRGGCYFNGTVSPSWSYFATVRDFHPFPGPGAKGNQGWVNQRTGSPHWKKKRLGSTHASKCISSSWTRAGHPNRNVFQLARKGPDQMLWRCSFQHRLLKRVYVYATWWCLFSTPVGRAIKPHDTGEPSSLSQASDHYIDSPTGSASPLQKREL